MKKHCSALTTTSGFRLYRAFSIDHNAMRLRKHCERLRRKSAVAPGWRHVWARARILRLRARRAHPGATA